jgi:hypothetical protein
LPYASRRVIRGAAHPRDKSHEAAQADALKFDEEFNEAVIARTQPFSLF